MLVLNKDKAKELCLFYKRQHVYSIQAVDVFIIEAFI